MSDIHGLESNFDPVNGSGSITVLFHIPINVDGNSPTGIGNYPIDETRTSQAPTNVNYATELAAIQGSTSGPTNPSLYEHVETIDINEAKNNAKIIAIIEARFTALSTAIPQRLAKKYRFYGVTRDVA